MLKGRETFLYREGLNKTRYFRMEKSQVHLFAIGAFKSRSGLDNVLQEYLIYSFVLLVK